MALSTSTHAVIRTNPTKHVISKHPDSSLANDLTMAARGLCMGAADVVPGVSGGTVALILGIYTRWVTAISRLDGETIRLVIRREWRAAAERCDLRFLVGLGCGVVCGVGTMTVVMNKLLTTDFTRSLTMAAFFGMILASALLVARLISLRDWTEAPRLAILGMAGAALAYWLTTLHHGEAADPTLPYLFFCGCVAICAMVLPGISGAMLLLVLGVYEFLTELLKEFPQRLIHGEPITHSLTVIAVFGSGCLISLLGFSRVLRWLLGTYRTPTMAVLCGFIFGALPEIWPYKIDQTPEIAKFREKTFESYIPDFTTPDHWLIAVVGVLAFSAVVLIDYRVRSRRPADAADEM